MRRIMIGLMGTISGLVLLFSYGTSTNSGGVSAAAGKGSGGTSGTGSTTDAGPTSDPVPTDAPSTDTAAAAGDPSTAAAVSSPAAKKTTAKPTGVNGTFDGDPVNTQWGIVQVEIVVKRNKIVHSDAIQVPHDNGRDAEINGVAIPILNQTTIDHQNAHFDGVSGATVSSDGYKASLQSALDKAHL